jgi:lipoprotein-anchoring transpeptidase ErfK/SrfK
MDMYLGSPGEKGSMFVRSFNVGLGKHGSTPLGTWMLTPQSKLRNPKWWGTGDEPAKEADDPTNPLGEYWMGLTGVEGESLGKEGFGIHGTIDPDSIGKEMSHGCIRLVNDDVARIYEMLTDGRSTVIVKE